MSRCFKVCLLVLLVAIGVIGMVACGSSIDAKRGIEAVSLRIDDLSVLGKVIAGYQGWFNAPGDSSPIDRWVHWSPGHKGSPRAGNQTFELWPDVREYADEDLFQTGYAPLGNGEPARLFSSFPESVTDLHFQWMQEYGVDGVALQRFLIELYDPRHMENRNQIALNVKKAAEKYGRLFYIMYDISGISSNNELVKDIQYDWTTSIIERLDLISSRQYARQDGKPVVCIWGFGFTDRAGTQEQAKELVKWFKEQGYYVIGGVPTNWRTSSGDSKPGWEDVYKEFDMLSPWTVGRYSSDEEVDKFYSRYLAPDFEYCLKHGIDYQPVVFPGFAWSNWNGGKPNAIPRRAGDLFWRQAQNVRKAGIPAMYIAMFDEYDEGTAIAKAAEDSSMIPTDQYFLTFDADGVSLSSDFYLRLAGAAAKMIKEEVPLTEKVPIPYSLDD